LLAAADPLHAVTRLLPEIAKKPAEFFVKVKLHGSTVPDASQAVNTPTTVPGGALLFTSKLLILIVMRLSASPWGKPDVNGHFLELSGNAPMGLNIFL